MSAPLQAIGLRCPDCGDELGQVVDTRGARGRIRRRRRCVGCGSRTTTYETIEHVGVPSAQERALELFAELVGKIDPLRHVPEGAAHFLTPQQASVLQLRLGGRTATQISVDLQVGKPRVHELLAQVREMLFREIAPPPVPEVETSEPDAPLECAS